MKFYDKLPNLYKRSFCWKSIWFAMSIVWFIYLSVLDKDNNFVLLTWWVLLWYPTIWWIIGIMWVMDKSPILNFRLYLWRGLIIWAFMNWLLGLLASEPILLMINTITPYEVTTWLFFTAFIIEWAVIWLLIDYVTTKFYWEGKSLLN